ncbi:uncharacterized protein LOC8281799 [Ricinus communis]|uniref:uncharacterized protein LOC8281799 n=1 Tax=Ricinus communis TaxID=3988 RepID=UPI00201A7727|nr:uncharacterized protein LOC8281799 [Ricinus communis]
MDSKNFYTSKTQFDFVNKGLLYDFLVDNMYRVVSFFWSFLCSYTFYLFGSFFSHFFKFQKGKSLEKYESESNEVYHQEENNRSGPSCFLDSDIDQTDGEGENSVVMETALSASTNRYEFLSGKGISGFLEEPRTASFIVHELFIDSNNDAIISNSIFDTGEFTEDDLYDVGLDADKSEETEKTDSFAKSFMIDEEVTEKQGQEIFMDEMSTEEEGFVTNDGAIADEDIGNQELDAAEAENFVENLVNAQFLKKPKVETLTTEKDSNKEEKIHLQNSFEIKRDSSGEVQLLSQFQSFSCDTEEKSDPSNDELFLRKDETVSASQTAEEACKPEILVWLQEEKQENVREAEPVFDGVEPESCEFADQPTDSDDEYIELKPQQKNSSLSYREDLRNVVGGQEQQASAQEKAETKPDGSERSEESSFKDEKSSNDIEYMLEHQDIVEQLKLELKLARTGGLPTILEESESEELETPKTVQELKPLKIEEKKLEYKDFLDGIHKVYKSYLDKMRKLDILNFQTMHALGLLQMKDTVQLQTARKSSLLAMTSLLSQNLWLCKGSAVVDPLKKVIADMNSDFETIYVGQLCLSWEMLHWQYWKVQELQKYDSQGSHHYNQVAGEFQLFQVLIQRFIENEPFQGPRVQNYVKNRCVLRSLLQVPLVKDDCIKDKGKRGDEGQHAITSPTLRGIIELSMQVFWEFLRADKDESNVTFQGNLQAHPNLQDLVDLELFTDVRTDYQKKDRKLKDISRSGNCIVKRFKKQQENGMHQTLLIAQVEMKLISRVLNMAKVTTDQLIWCHEKLDKINISNRKVFVESSFLLFPC